MNEFMEISPREVGGVFLMSQKNRKLGRTSDQRRAMLRAMVTYLSLIHISAPTRPY